jgi:hypothetical protein
LAFLVAAALGSLATRIASAGAERAQSEQFRYRAKSVSPEDIKLSEALKRTAARLSSPKDDREIEDFKRKWGGADLDDETIKGIIAIREVVRRTEPLHDRVLAAEHWLKPTERSVPEPLRSSGVQGGLSRADRSQIVYNSQIAEAFGWTACQEILPLLAHRPRTVSKLGSEPALYVLSTRKDSPNTAESVIRREEGKWVEYPLDDVELARQQKNIVERLSPLTAKGVSYLALTAWGEVLLIDKERSQTITDEAGLTARLRERSDNTPTSLILVRETVNTSLDAEFQRLKELVRVCEDEGKLRGYEDDDPELAAQNVNAQQPVTSAKDVAVYADSVINDGKILAGLETSFKICTTPEIVTAGNLIIITGHKDEQLKQYLRGLSANGVLRGKTVALVSCADSGDRALCQQLIKAGGATCVLRMNQRIDSAAARNVLIKVADTLGHLPENGLHFNELWKQAVDAAEDEAVSDLDKEKIRAIRDYTKQVSLLFQSERTMRYE